jgi:glycosyltransferase involved in cell wall biosynthesis
MVSIHKYISANPDLPAPPAALVKQAGHLMSNPNTPEKAKAALDQLIPEIGKYTPDPGFLLPCGMLLEKMRINDGMLDIWFEFYELFPGELLPIRMMMRWFRRLGQVEEGLVRLQVLCPDPLTNLEHAGQLVAGLIELKEFSGLDNTVRQILKAFPNDSSFRLTYARMLFQQKRIPEANAILKDLDRSAPQNPSTQKMIAEIKAQAELLESYNAVDSAAMIGKMVDIFASRTPRPVSENGLGPIVFYTGQLGAGGAERQMTRIAGAFMQHYKDRTPIGGRRLLSAPLVCIRHTTAATKSGFFLPVLAGAGIDVHTLNEAPLPRGNDIPEIPADLQALMGFLPTDIYENTLKLARYFTDTRAEYVYCWQDGGVLTSALAALIAGVPRIITSFRGMPPNLRPDMFRPQMPYLYKALRHVPGVGFSANNGISARAYEDWLGFGNGEITVINNAVPPVLPQGDSAARDIWNDITAKSPDCDRTVLGIFRFEMVKNPRLWIAVAEAYLEQVPNTRFVAFGTGSLLEECRRRVARAGLENRIFLPGATSSVGYFMHRSDVLLHLAHTEGLPNVLIEGHLSGLPLLATPAGGTVEILQDGVSGWLLSCADTAPVEEVTEKLALLLTNPDMMKTMGDAGLEQAARLFSIDTILEKTVSLFALDGT